MALRFGEMVLVVRTQDFASRNLHRVAGELHTLSRQQQAFNAVQAHNLKLTKAQDRISDISRDKQRLKIVQDSISANKKLAMAQLAVARSEAAVAKSRVSGGPAGGQRGLGVPKVPGRTHAANLAQLAIYQDALTAATVEAQKADEALSALPNSFRNLAKDAALADDALVKNARSARDAQFALRVLQQETLALDFATKKSTLSLEKWLSRGHAMGRMGRVMQLSGLAMTAAMGAAAKIAADFDTTVTLAGTQARDIQAPMSQVAERANQIGDAILDMMGRFPASQQEMSDAAYEIFSSLNLEKNGIIDVTKGLALLEQANKMAVAGQGTLAESTNAMIVLLNDFPKEEPLELFDTMFDIIRFGKMQITEFNNMLGDVAPAAKGAGQSLEDVSGAMSYLTRVMPKTSRAGVGLRRFFDILHDPLIKQGLRDWGIEIEKATGGLKPLPKIIKDIVRTFPTLKTGQADITNWLMKMSQEGAIVGKGLGKGVGKQFTSQGRSAATFLFQGADAYLEDQKRTMENTKEFNKSYAAMMKTQGMQWKVTVNQLKALVIIIGQAALPTFLSLMDRLRGLVQWFKNLDPHTQNLIIRVGTLIGILTLLGGVVGSITGALVSLASVIGLFTTRWIFMRKAMDATSTSTGAKAVGMFSSIASAATIAAKRIGLVYAAYLAFDLATNQGTRRTLWDDLTSGRPGEGIVNWLLPGNPATSMMKWMEKNAPGFMSEGKQATIDRLMDRSGLSKKSLRQAHDDFLKMSVKERVRMIKEWDSWGMKDELLHRLSFGSIKEALKSEKTGKSLSQQYEEALKDINSGDLAKAYKEAMDEYEKSMSKAGAGTNELVQRTNELKRVMKEAWDQEFDAATDRLSQAAQTMAAKFTELKDANTQLWGSLFEGPVLKSETFNIAKEWGISPALKHINMDLAATNKRFVKFQSNLNKLRKKGVPEEVVQEIAKMGAEEGLKWSDAILKGDPKEFQIFLNHLKTRKREIQKATELDFNRLRKHWMALGKSGADAFIAGLTDPNVGLTAFFEKWINNTFPGYAKAAADAAAAAAAAAFNENNPLPTTSTGNGKGGQGGWPGAIDAATYLSNLQSMGYSAFNPNLVRKPTEPAHIGRGYPTRRTSSMGSTVNHYDYSTTVEVKGEISSPEKGRELARKIAFEVKNRRTPPRKDHQ